MRNIISKQNTLILLLSSSPAIIGVFILCCFTVNGLDFQNIYYTKMGLTCWITINSTTMPIIYWYSQRFDRELERLQQLNGAELTQLSSNLLRMPIRVTIILTIILFLENGSLFLVLLNGNLSTLSLSSTSLALSSSLIAVAPIGFFCSTFFLRPINQRVYSELHKRGLPIIAPFIGYRIKLLTAFGSSILGITIWLIGFAYYFSINNTISNTLVQSTYLQETLITHLPDSTKNSESVQDLIPYFNKTKLSATGSWLIVNNTGKVVLNPKNTTLYTTIFPKLNQLMRYDFLQRNTNAFYDNKDARLISYTPINDTHTLLLTSHVSDLMQGYGTFWLWASVFIGIAVVVLFFITYIFSETIVTSLKYMSRLMLDISAGDLTQTALVDTVDETSIVLDSYNILTQKNTTLLRKIKLKSKEFLNASQQLSAISDKTAQSSIEQAATTDKLSTILFQKLSTEEENSQKAEIARDTSLVAAREMKESTDLFMKTIHAIIEISTKTDIISDIANKTDMLSINASIEAARAGKVGKGFGVVAQEVRKLSVRTKQASVEINSLSESGHEMSQKSSIALNKLIPQVNDSADHASDIYESNLEQQATTKIINTSILELSDVTNHNASAAEEMAASAEELAYNATFLVELIGNFKINTHNKGTE